SINDRETRAIASPTVDAAVTSTIRLLMARSEGFEPPTPRFEVWCSIQLSYERPVRRCPPGQHTAGHAIWKPSQQAQTFTERTTMTQWEPSGFVKLMGIKVIKRSPELSEAELVIREDLCNRRGVMHGGAVMGWADTMGGMTASAGIAADQ